MPDQSTNFEQNTRRSDDSERRKRDIQDEIEDKKVLLSLDNKISNAAQRELEIRFSIYRNLNASKDLSKSIQKNVNIQARVEAEIARYKNDAIKDRAEELKQIRDQIKAGNDSEDQYKRLSDLSKDDLGKEALKLTLLKEQKEAIEGVILSSTDALNLSKKLDRGFFSIAHNISSTVPELGKISQTFEEAAKSSREAGNGVKGMTAGFITMSDLAVDGYMALIAKKAFESDVQVTNMAKSLGISKDQALGLRQSFAAYSRDTGDAFITTNKLVKAQGELSQELGVAGKYTGKQTEDFTRLTELIGLSASEAGKLARLSIINNKSIEDTAKSIIKGSAAAQRGNKISIDQRTILKDVANLSEGILIKFQGNPEALGQAVVQARRLGTTLETIDKIGESLLNFESSIENELKAELITGRQINLEKARYASLTGNQLELTRAITDEVGNLNDFQSMNVIAQKSLADAFGLSRDELSKMLLEQEKFNKLGDVSQMTLDNQLKALTAQGEPLDSALYKQIQQQSAQEKFNNAIEKLSSLLGDIVAGPLGKLIDGFSDLVKSAGGLYTIMGVLLAGKIVSIISSIRQQVALQRTLTLLSEGEAAAKTVSVAAISFGALVPVVLAAGLAAYSLFASKSMDDGELGPNGKILYTAQEGAIRLNDEDRVAVGTDLFAPSNNSNMATAFMSLQTTLKQFINRPAIAYIQGENPFIKNVASNANFGSQQMIDTYGLA